MKDEEKQTEKIQVVLDTNVLVSALLTSNPHSPTVQIVSFLYKGILEPLYNEKIIVEYRDVLNRERFKFDKALVEELITTIRSLGINIKEEATYNEIFPDPDDVIFYEVRMSVDDYYLVTGNIKHFPKKPFIVTPAQMLEILKARNLI